MAHDVFISYSVKDRLKSDAICHILEEERIRCWIAPRDISPGGSWAAEIADSIPLSKIMLLVFSQNANSSKQVLREIELAISNDVIIIPVKIEDVVPTGGMSYYLSTTHWIDAVGDKLDDRIQKLADKIKTMLQIDAELPKTSIIEDKPIKAIPVASAPQPGKMMDSDDKRKRKRKPLVIITTILAALAIITAGYFLYPYLFDEVSENGPKSTSFKTMNPLDKFYPGVSAGPKAAPEDYGLNPATRVSITDQNLEAVIRDILSKLEKPAGDYLTIQDMFNLTCLAVLQPGEYLPMGEEFLHSDEEVFSYIDSNISSLAGMQYAYNLKVLSLGNCSISDLSPLSTLGNLISVFLYDNNVSDLQPLSGLSNLRSLHLGSNLITDISPLSGLTGLESLYIDENPITDLSVLSNLTSLRSLGLDGLNISDLSFITSLENLGDLNVNHNNISNLEPLSEMSSLSTLGIYGNKLVDLNPLLEVPMLQSLDIGENPIQDFSSLSELGFLKILRMANLQLSDLSMVSSLAFLESLSLENNNISDLTPLEGLTRLNELILTGNNITEMSPLVKLSALKHLNLLQNPAEDIGYCEAMESLTTLYINIGTYQNNISTVSYLKSKGCSVFTNDNGEFNEILIFEPKDYGYNPDSHVNIEDENLRAGIVETLSAIGAPIDTRIKISDMFNLIYLDFCPEDKEPEYFYQDIYRALGYLDADRYIVRVNDITGLNGLQYAKNLLFLILPYYNISDLTPISSLDSLLALWIDSTKGLSDINAIESLTNLRHLMINNFKSSDISPVSNLKNLQSLDINSYNSAILDITPLNGLDLRDLSLRGFIIDNLEAIGTLWNLSSLNIKSFGVTDLTPLSKLSNLEYLYISDNSVSDISPLAELQKLKYLTLENCSIESIEGLQNLVNLQELYLDASTYDKNPVIINAIKSNGCIVYKINP